jgi:hypothetical protein
MIQHAGHNCIDDFNNRFRIRIKNWIGWKNYRARRDEQLEIFYMNQTQRRFARDENQFFLFLQNHVGGAKQNIFAETVRNPTERSHGAGNHDHRIRRIRAAGERRVHAFERVHFRACRKFQSIGQFLRDDLMRVIAHHDMDLVLLRVEIIKQPLCVKRTAGSGDGDENFQSRKLWRADESGARFPWPLLMRTHASRV